VLRRLRLMVLAVACAAFMFSSAGIALAGTISGEVVSLSNPANALPSVTVEVYSGASLVTSTTTNMLGMYSCEVPDGVYTVRFDPSLYNMALGTHFAALWYSDVFEQTAAYPVFISEFAPVAIANAFLYESPSISGTLTSAVNGDTLDGVGVSIRDNSNTEVATAVTDATGHFSVQGLPPTQLTVLFDPTGYNDAHPGKPYHMGMPSSGIPTVVTVDYNTDTDVTQSLEALRLYGYANGWGSGLGSGVDVELWDAEGIVATTTVEVGMYEFYPRPGTYKLRFDPARVNADNSWNTPLAPEWWSSQLTSDTAMSLTPDAGNRAIRADAYLNPKYLELVANNVIEGVMPGATVRLYDSMGIETTSSVTDVDGIARFNPAPDGTIYAKLDLVAYNLANGTDLPDQWYSGKKTFETADGFFITYGMSDQRTFDVWPPSKIGGTVTDNVGDPAQDVDVAIFNAEGAEYSLVATASTGPDGSYSVTVPPYGLYVAQFDASRHNSLYARDLRSGFWSYGQLVYEGFSASTVSANPGATTDVSVQLPATISVAGRVTGKAGAPVPNINVLAIPIPRADVTEEQVLQDISNAGTSAQTDAEGRYRVEFADNEWMLPYIEGVQLSFHPGSTGYLFEYWRNTVDPASAEPIPLAVGVQATVDATLTIGSTIAGRVTSKTGDPLAGVAVLAKRAGDTMWLIMGFTDDNGDYSATGFAAGDYTLQFDPTSPNSMNQTYYETAFWDSRSTEASADVVTVPTEADLTGYDIQLTEAVGSVSGVVRDPAGLPLQGVPITAYRYEMAEGDGGPQMQWLVIDPSVMTDENGEYSFPRLHSGEFRLYYATPNPELASEWYDNQHLDSRADTLVVGTGAVLASVDATLEAVGHLTGTLTDELSGAPVVGAPVKVYAAGATGWDIVGTGGSDGAGHYDVAVSADGPVRVRFGDAAETFNASGTWYVSEFHSNASTVTAAQDIAAGLGLSATVDASLTPAATMGGNVAYNRLLGDVSVEALRNDGTGWRVVHSHLMESGWNGGPDGNPGDIDGDGIPDFIDSDRDGDGILNDIDPFPDTPDLFNGRYEIKGLKPGDYKVRFVDAAGYYVPQFFDGARFESDATTLTLAAAQTRSDIDATMVAGSRILGSVNPPSLPGVDGPPVYTHVAFYRLLDGAWHFGGDTTADLAGNFKVTGLETGTYTLVASVDKSADGGVRTYVPEQWSNAVASGFDEDLPAAFTPNAWATLINVVEGEDTVLAEQIVLQKADVLDRGAPVSSSDAPAGWSNHDVVVHLSAVDAAGSPVGTYGGLGSSALTPRTVLPTITAEGDTTIRFYAEDAHGNRETTRTATVRIDKTAPKTLDDHVAAYAETAFVRMYGTDALSGPDETRYTLDGGPETIGGAVVTTETGGHELTYWSTDKAGNVETPKTITFSVGGDMTAPYTTAIAPVGWQAPPVTVELLAVDDSSGVAHTYYSTDGSVPTLEYTGPIEITATGNHLVKYRSVDVAGNTEALRFAAVWVDGLAPSTESSVTTSATSGTVWMKPKDTHSGVASTRYRIDGGAEIVNTTAEFSVVVSGVGTHTVEFHATDKVGNAEEPQTRTFRVGPATEPATVTRVSGSSRYETAAQLARTGWAAGGAWTGVRHVVIANGEPGKEADPLTAAGLAGVYSAPVLLVQAGSLPAPTRKVLAELATAQPGVKVHIVGGTGAVSDAVWASIKAVPGVSATKDRVFGPTRYDTSVAIAKRMLAVAAAVPGMEIPGVLIVNAENSAAFYDGLAASPASYAKHLPMVSVQGRSVPSAVRTLLGAGLAGKPRYLVSGTGYLNATVQSQTGATERLTTSSDRYTAAAQIATQLDDRDWNAAADTGLAAQLPDALTGGTFMGRKNGVLLFTDSSATMKTAAAGYITTNKAQISRGWVIGGTNSVSAATANSFLQLLQ